MQRETSTIVGRTQKNQRSCTRKNTGTTSNPSKRQSPVRFVGYHLHGIARVPTLPWNKQKTVDGQAQNLFPKVVPEVFSLVAGVVISRNYLLRKRITMTTEL